MSGLKSYTMLSLFGINGVNAMFSNSVMDAVYAKKEKEIHDANVEFTATTMKCLQTELTQHQTELRELKKKIKLEQELRRNLLRGLTIMVVYCDPIPVSLARMALKYKHNLLDEQKLRERTLSQLKVDFNGEVNIAIDDDVRWTGSNYEITDEMIEQVNKMMDLNQE